jgi:DMSO/TMAO reductase YedYZ molybdopterin-dependent catalytic subunit
MQDIMITFKISQNDRKLNLLFLILFSFAAGINPFLGTAQEKAELPPGQRAVNNFPVLHIGPIPDLDWTNWHLEITGLVADTLSFDWGEFLRFDTVQTVNDFHCVTGWSRLNNQWTGVQIKRLLKKATADTSARFITFQAADGYYTSLPLDACTGDEDILAFRWEGKLIDKNLGGPVRVVIPEKYGYKSAMWLTKMILTKDEEPGYWETRGYSDSADPWMEERYAPAQNSDTLE